MDSLTWTKNGNDCSWVAEDVSLSRCAEEGDDGTYAYQECLVACSTCPSTCTDEDSSEWTRAEGKDCDWAAAYHGPRCALLDDDTSIFGFEACPHACRVCTFCDDSKDWYVEGFPDQNCDWIADASKNRCRNIGQDGRRAYEACPDACRVCPNFGDCKDSRSWYKNGDDARTCNWVRGKPHKRCSSKGVDGTWAYESCRDACGLCDI